MSIELHCVSCGKLIAMARDKGGTWGKCPNCDSDVYIPTPEAEIEELPLSPEDTEEVKREALLKKERQQLERMIARDESIPAGLGSSDSDSGVDTGQKDTIKLSDVLNAYLIAMRDSNLQGAEEALSILLKYRDNTLRIIDRLTADQIPPPSMANVPMAVYQGFLRNLRSQM